MQSLFSQQSLENFSFTECCLRQLPSCHQSRKNQETSARCLLVSYLSPVGFSFLWLKRVPRLDGVLAHPQRQLQCSLQRPLPPAANSPAWCLAVVTEQWTLLSPLSYRAMLCCARVFSPEMGSLVFSSKSLRLEKGQAIVNISLPSSDRWLNPLNLNEVNNDNVNIFYQY